MTTTPSKRGPGQPSKLPEVADDLILLIKNGINYVTACDKLDITIRSYMKWKARGEQAEIVANATGQPIPASEESYVQFVHDLKTARYSLRGRLEERYVNLVPKMEARDVLKGLQAIAPEDYSKGRVQVDVNVSGGVAQVYGEEIGRLLRGVLDELLACKNMTIARRLANQIVARQLALVSDVGDEGEGDEDVVLEGEIVE